MLANTALLLGIAAVVTFWVLQWASVRTPREPLVPVPPVDRVARTQPIDTRPAANLFGRGEAAPQVQVRQEAPSLRVRLDGVIAEGPRGVALLSVDERAALAYRVGDRIDAHHTLAEVQADRVVIRAASGRMEIMLPERPPPTGIVPVR